VVEKRQRGRPKVAPDAEQRDRIVDIGRGVFLDRGYGRSTMDEVAARGCVSKKTLYRFFANKLELFAAVVEAHRHSMLAFPDDLDACDIEEALRVIVRLDIDADQDRERHALLEMAFFESAAHPELHEVIFLHGAERSRRDLTERLQQWAAAGKLVLDDAGLAAGILMDMVFGAGRRPPRPGEVEEPETRRRHLKACIAVFLRGTMPRQGLPAAPLQDERTPTPP
jgi:AcrR family transcriptional regulator